MANEKIEIDIVLNDGSIAKGFAKINEEAKKSEGFLNDAFKILTGVQLSNAVDRVASGLKGLFNDAIREAIQGEEAINQLTSSMQSAGTYTNAAVESFQKLADRLQTTTKFSDDAVLSAGALARNFTKTNDQAEKLTEAAVQLSAATGRDLNTSIEQLGGTLTGTAGRLGKVVPELNGLTEASLRSGAAIDVVFNRFAGTAERQLNTFGGAIALAKNQFNNFLEDLGNQIIRNPTFIAALKGFGDFFNNVINNFSGNATKSRSIIDSVVIAGVDGFTLLAKAVAFVGNNIDSIKLGFTSLYLVVLKANQGILDFDLAVSRLGNKIGTTSDAYLEKSKKLNEANQQSIKNAEALGDTIAESQLKNAGQFDFLIKEADRLKNSVIEASKQIGLVKVNQAPDQKGTSNINIVDQKALDEEFKKVLALQDKAFAAKDEILKLGESLNFVDISPFTDGLASGFDILNEKSASSLEKMISNFDSAKQQIQGSAAQINQAIANGLANGISNGIQAFVNAIANGENAFKAFADSILQTFGDLAIQLGTFFVAQGLASLLMRFLDPTGTIAAGLGLIALGSVMKAFFAGGKSSASKGGAAGGSITPPLTPATPVSGVSDNVADTQSKVQVIVEGNIFDSDATGLRIATILKEQGFANAVRA